MGKKLFISNLDFEVTTDQLRDMFLEHGACNNVVIAVERDTKRSKGFAFIEMENDEEAKKAIDGLNNKIINGRPMKVCEDRGKTNQPGGGGGDSYRSEGGGRTREILPSI